MSRIGWISATALATLVWVDVASAQIALPPITVTAPSPIRRDAPSAPVAKPDAAATAAPGPPNEPVSPLGALPIVADQFATVTVVPSEELRRAPTSTLGDVLFSKPGITGSGFAPGASSRPIIRGLDVNRVGIVENGTAAGGASDLGEDHFVPVTPPAATQVEVIRGPATLRYGSQSIGGVVSTTNNRIPDALPFCRNDPRWNGSSTCANLELRGAARQAVYSQRDAVFRGGEFQAQYDVARVLNGVWGFEGQFDVVRATFTDGTNVPRITPMRLGGGAFYRDGNWLARVNLIHAFAQNDVAPNETPTDGYNLLKAEISYTQKIANSRLGEPCEFTLGVVGSNLLNEQIRASTSYTKDEVLLPGASVRAFANVKF